MVKSLFPVANRARDDFDLWMAGTGAGVGVGAAAACIEKSMVQSRLDMIGSFILKISQQASRLRLDDEGLMMIKVGS